MFIIYFSNTLKNLIIYYYIHTTSTDTSNDIDTNDTLMCQWYKKNVKKLSDNIWLPVISDEIDYKPKYPFSQTTSIKFEAKTNKNLIKNNIDYISSQDDLKIHIEYFNKKLNKINDSNLNSDEKKKKKVKLYDEHIKMFEHYNDVIKTIQIHLELNKEQKSTINNWLIECDKVYNYCVKKYNDNPYSFDMNYKSLKLEVFNQLYGTNKKPCPYDMLTDEVRIFCSNLKSCQSNLANGYIKHYTMKRHNTIYSQSILISKNSINKTGIFPSFLGEIKGFKLDSEYANCDSRLLIDKIHKKYILCIPQYQKKFFEKQTEKIINNIECNQIYNKEINEIGAIDLGERIPFTIYSENHYVKIGEDIRKNILDYQMRIRQMQRALSKNINRNNKKLMNKKKLKVKIRLTYGHIKNLVKELHNQTANYLVKNYKRILIPEFKTQEMIKNVNLTDNKQKARVNKLDKRVKFVLLMLSHYRFRQHLTNKCVEYGCQIDVVTEEYTSMCCTKCGSLSKKYNGREKHCDNCGYKINRDVNGARNILLKNAKQHIKLRL